MSKRWTQFIHTEPRHRNIVLVNWILGDVCNYACPYCPEELNGGRNGWVSFKDIKVFTRKAIEHYVSEKGKRLYFCLTGGEVTCNNELYDICSFLHDNDCGVALISNGGASLDLWRKLIPVIDHTGFSYHSFFSKDSHFIDVVDIVHREVTTHVAIMMHPRRFSQCLNIGTQMLSRFTDISMSFSSLMEQLGVNQDLMTYSQEQWDEISRLEAAAQQIKWTKAPETYRGTMTKVYEDGSMEAVSNQQLVNSGETGFKGWQCYAGCEMLSVFYNGDVYPSWCFEGEKTGRIGSVYDDVIPFPDGPLVCPFDSCWDYSDLLIKKTAPWCSISHEKDQL